MAEPLSRRLFAEAFPPDSVTVYDFGNVLAATAFLHGVAARELKPTEMDARDRRYTVTVAIRAMKAHCAGGKGAA